MKIKSRWTPKQKEKNPKFVRFVEIRLWDTILMLSLVRAAKLSLEEMLWRTRWVMQKFWNFEVFEFWWAKIIFYTFVFRKRKKLDFQADGQNSKKWYKSNKKMDKNPIKISKMDKIKKWMKNPKNCWKFKKKIGQKFIISKMDKNWT